MSWYSAAEPLAPDHETADLDCGSDAQTAWLRQHALQAQRGDTCRVYVVCRSGERRVVGYYALAAGSVAREHAPARALKGMGRYPVPVVVLTRLGIDRSEQRMGLGRALLKDALLRIAGAADTIGIRALLIHCESDAAKAFYLQIAAFDESPTDPLHLFLLMKDLRLALQAAAEG